MSIFAIMNMPSSFITEEFAGAIWRMEIDSISENIFVETRNSAEKKVAFASINLSTGKINFKDLSSPDRWLTGIEAAYNGVLLLHNYQSESSPVHKGLTAINAENGATLWSNYTYAFDHLSINGPVLCNVQIQPKKLFLVDIKTGGDSGSYQPARDRELINDIVVPQMLPVSFLKQKTPFEPYGNNMHYHEHNNLRIVSLHSFEAGNLKQHLYIMNDLQPVYEDILNIDIQKVQPEAFIIHRNHLIYIKNKFQLRVLNL